MMTSTLERLRERTEVPLFVWFSQLPEIGLSLKRRPVADSCSGIGK